MNKICPFRHPTRVPAPVTVERNKIPCYHLTQPGGCLKGKDCPYSHLQSIITNNQINQKPVDVEILPKTTKIENKSLSKAIDSIKKEKTDVPQKKAKIPANELNNIPPKKKRLPEKVHKKKKLKAKQKAKLTKLLKKKVDYGVKKLDELLGQKKAGDISPVGQKRSEIADQEENTAKRQKIEDQENLELVDSGVDLNQEEVGVDEEVDIDTL